MREPLVEDDIYHVAKQLADRYGAGAVVEAATRAGRTLECGDLKSAANWDRIIQVIYELRLADVETKH